MQKMGEGLELVSSSSSKVHHGDQKKKKKMHAASSDVVVVKSDGSSSLPKDKNSKKKKNKIHEVVDHAPTSVGDGASSLAKKKAIASQRLWMRFDRNGQSEVLECDKSTIVKRVSISPRDFRILASVSSHSANILAREKAMVINLEFIKAIITTEEVLLLDPLGQDVLPFVDQLRQQLPRKSPFTPEPNLIDMQEKEVQFSTGGQWLPVPEAAEEVHHELPFEFQVLEIALEVICTYLDTSVAYVEKDAYPVLDELTRNVSTKNLERVRSLKSNLTLLLARVQKVRDEIEHLLDDNEDMAHLYLTRKQIQNQQIGDSDRLSITPNQPRRRSNNRSSASFITSAYDDDKVVDLEMLLEAYFMQLDGTRNKILSVREYIDDTEDYVNIQLGNKRNDLIQLQLLLTIASVPVTIETYIVGMFSINIQCAIYNVNGVFGLFSGSLTSAGFLLFLLILGYARWKKLIGS